MKHPYNKQKTASVWDYDIRQLNFSDPQIMRWYLTRRIQHTDWKGLRKNDLKQHLSKLDISPGLKILLKSILYGIN